MSVVVVGAGLGGLRAAEGLRGGGHLGPITVVGAELHLPYNRPPLSKEALAQGVSITDLEFRRRAGVADVEWRLGTPVTAADLARGRVELADGSAIDFDGLVAATGLRPRRLAAPGPATGRHVLRTAEDATELHAELRPGARVVVVGAGFIGCEVAATAIGLGADVTCVAIETAPMIRPIGPELGAAMRRRHERAGVGFRLGVGIDRFLGSDRVTGVELSSGEVLTADVVVEAVGSECNVDWLSDNSLDLSDGIRCDGRLRMVTGDGTALDNCYAVGDVARFPNLRFDEVPRRVEHWSMPTDTGRYAGGRLAAALSGDRSETGPVAGCIPLPAFWSDQYDLRLQAFGMPGLGDRTRVLHGDAEGEVVMGYLRTDPAGAEPVLVGVIGIGLLPQVMALRSSIGSVFAG